MSVKKIVIPYFPAGLKYAAPFILGAGIYLWTIGYPGWTLVATLLAIILLTTNYVTEISLDKKEYRDYLSFLWIPVKEERSKFNAIEKIIIRKENHAQMLNTRSRSRQIDWQSFTGTLLLDGNKSLDLLTKTDKKELIKGLKAFSAYLKVDVEDHTTGRFYIVDMTRV
jgi:hypothetical protein